MSMRRSQNAADQHSGRRCVGAEARAAGHFVDAVGPQRTGSNDREFSIEGGHHIEGHDQAPCISLAALWTARTTLS
jgi:hypothetical protein